MNEAAGAADASRAMLPTSTTIDPNRFNGLYGAGRAAELANQPEKARSYYATLVKNCEGSNSDRPELARARAALENEPTNHNQNGASSSAARGVKLEPLFQVSMLKASRKR